MEKARAEGQQEIDEANWQSKKNLISIRETTADVKLSDALVKKTKRDADVRYGALKIAKNVNKFKEYATRASAGFSKVAGTSSGASNISNRANRNKYNAVLAMVAQKAAIAEETGGQILRRKYNENQAIYQAQVARSLENFIPQAGSPGRFWADQSQFMRGLNTVGQVTNIAMGIPTRGFGDGALYNIFGGKIS